MTTCWPLRRVKLGLPASSFMPSIATVTPDPSAIVSASSGPGPSSFIDCSASGSTSGWPGSLGQTCWGAAATFDVV